jgi:hypothetical protein
MAWLIQKDRFLPGIICGICTDVVKDARTACGQGHVFCEPCITHPRSGPARVV